MISRDGANVLLQLMKDKIKLRHGVYVRELLRQLAHDRQGQVQDVNDPL